MPDTMEDSAVQIERQEFLKFRRTLRLIEWLLPMVMGLYLLVPGVIFHELHIMLDGMIVYVFFIVFMEFSSRSAQNTHTVIFIEIAGMIMFITVMLWETGRIESPLRSLYFFPLIAAAISLPRSSIYITGLITALCMFMTLYNNGLDSLSHRQLIYVAIMIFSFWLVSYLASVQSSNMIEARRKIQMLSETDYLTGLNNMRTFLRLAQREYERSIRHGYPFSILMIDADNLKPINDTYGHEYGSTMIKLVGEIIVRNLRTTDVSARYGGDEFVVLLTETESENATLTAERVRDEVAQTPLAVPQGSTSVTVSIGISCFPDHGIRIEHLIAKADEALYKSKSGGRNRITMASA